jgi:hypothetical protein
MEEVFGAGHAFSAYAIPKHVGKKTLEDVLFVSLRYFVLPPYLCDTDCDLVFSFSHRNETKIDSHHGKHEEANLTPTISHIDDNNKKTSPV